jgi:hypothetical protein
MEHLTGISLRNVCHPASNPLCSMIVSAVDKLQAVGRRRRVNYKEAAAAEHMVEARTAPALALLTQELS